MMSQSKPGNFSLRKKLFLLFFLLSGLEMLGFGGYSLWSARAFQQSVQEEIQRITQLSQGENQAQQMLQGVNQNLMGAWESAGGDLAAYEEAGAAALQFCTGMPFSVERTAVKFTVPYAKDRQLEVELAITPPDKAGRHYQIVRWEHTGVPAA